MPQSYTPEFKKKIVCLHEEEGSTYKRITAEYSVSKASISKWCSEFSKECQEKALENPDVPNEMELMKENLRLRKELNGAKKENLFLKKLNRLETYRIIDQYHELFGLHWLLRRLGIYPNAYYNYRKHRKADYYTKKESSRSDQRNLSRTH